MQPWAIFAVVVSGVLILIALIVCLTSIRRCPADKILVVYGKVKAGPDGKPRTAMCIHGGAIFVWPLIQSCAYLDLNPIPIDVGLKNALCKNNTLIDVTGRFAVGISTEPAVMQDAAERLLGLKQTEIGELAHDIILGQLRLVVSAMELEELAADGNRFLEALARNVETELKKIGLRLINLNLTGVTDEFGDPVKIRY